MAVRAPVIQREVRPGRVRRGLRITRQLGGALLLAWLCSIGLEWIGMTWWWPENGTAHAERMLQEELGYLNHNFKDSLVSTAPVRLVARTARAVRHYAFVVTGYLRWVSRLPPLSTPGTQWRGSVAAALGSIQPYLAVVPVVTQTFIVRLCVLALATPVFTLCGIVGLAEGLMRRDLRRWGGGRESSFIYHHGKQVLAPALLAAWMLYLAMPVSLPPSLILLPFALLFGVGVAVTASTFKKYL